MDLWKAVNSTSYYAKSIDDQSRMYYIFIYA